MNLTCFSCKKSWEVSQAHILGAKLKFGLGFKEHNFICPNCNSKNNVTKEAFEAALAHPHSDAAPVAPPISKDSRDDGKPAPRPVAPVNKPQVVAPVARPIVTTSAPAAPVVGAGPAIKERHGVVIVRSLHVRKDHSTTAETMAGLTKGEKVTVISTWTDGDNTWAQLGPDRWAAIIFNGEALIELSD